MGFIERYCRHTTGEYAGRHLILEPWQRDIVRTAFGWFRPDGRRRYNRVDQWVARKNGKSTLASAVALKLLLADREPGSQVFSCAGDRDQARIVYSDALRMVQMDRTLLKNCKPLLRSITVPSTGSRYEALSSDAPRKHGLNPHGVIFDEVHVQKSRELYETMETGMGSRRNPQMWDLSTAGDDRDTIGWEIFMYATQVATGAIEDSSVLPALYTTQPDDDWKDPEVWRKANPNLGVSVHPEWIAQQVKAAEANPAKENSVRRLYLNQWTEQSVRWIPLHVWDKGKAPVMTDAELRPFVCYGGLDLSESRDMTAFVLLFRTPAGLYARPWYWVPEEGVKRHAGQYGSLYREWSKRGFLTICPGHSIDYGDVMATILRASKEFDVQEIAFDPYNATDLTGKLEHEHGLKMIKCRQGMQTMNDPTKKFDSLVANGELLHGGHPVLRWNAANAELEIDKNKNWMPKKKCTTGRIDGLVACIMALYRFLAAPADSGQVIWG